MKWEVITTLTAAHLLYWSIISFHHNPWAHSDICPIWKKVWKFSRSSSWALVFTAINKQPLPLPHYIKISDLLNEWTSGPEFPRDDNCSNSHQTFIAWGSNYKLKGPLLTTDKFFGHWSNKWYAATNTTVRRKWKCLFMNNYKSKSLISTKTEFLYACQDEPNASICSGITMKHIMIVQDMSYT